MAKCSIMKQIERADDRIQACFYQVDTLEHRLRSQDLTDDAREALQRELTAVRAALARHEATLRTLHKENGKTFMTTAILVFFAFLVYGVYTMWTRG